MARYIWRHVPSPLDGSSVIGVKPFYIPELGRYYFVSNSTTDPVIWTPDGVAFTSLGAIYSPAPALGTNAIAYSASRAQFVVASFNSSATTDGPLWSSEDGGATWTDRGNPFDPGTTDPTAKAVIWIEDLHLWVAGSDSPFDLHNPNHGLATSPDGVTWTPATSPFDAPAGSESTVRDLAYSPSLGLILAVGLSYDGTVNAATSPDGVTWTPLGFIGTASYGITAAMWSARRGLFIVGKTEPVHSFYTSPDASSWTAQPYTDWDNRNATFGFGDTGHDIIVAGGNVFGGSPRPSVGSFGASDTWEDETNYWQAISGFGIGVASDGVSGTCYVAGNAGHPTIPGPIIFGELRRHIATLDFPAGPVFRGHVRVGA